MSRRYPPVYDGDVVQPIMDGYKMQCCDCGLVHRFRFSVHRIEGKRRVRFRAWRDNRATAQIRRRMGL